MAIFWLLLYVFVNLTSVLYLGALSLNTILDIPLTYGIIGLALFAMIYSIYGGLKAVAWTDVVQVFFPNRWWSCYYLHCLANGPVMEMLGKV